MELQRGIVFFYISSITFYLGTNSMYMHKHNTVFWFDTVSSSRVIPEKTFPLWQFLPSADVFHRSLDFNFMLCIYCMYTWYYHEMSPFHGNTHLSVRWPFSQPVRNWKLESKRVTEHDGALIVEITSRGPPVDLWKCQHWLCFYNPLFKLFTHRHVCTVHKLWVNVQVWQSHVHQCKTC